MPASLYFDHLAVGVRNWPEGFRRFAVEAVVRQGSVAL